jgi:PRC-barrel domain protein
MAIRERSTLRYLSPAHLEGPLPEGLVDVMDREDRRIGHFDGIVFDAAARRVRYVVVDASGLFKHRRYMVPIDPTQVDAEHRSLRVGMDSADLSHCKNFDPRAIPEFSDEDLLQALFADRSQQTSDTAIN